jgi:hypothetical protein
MQSYYPPPSPLGGARPTSRPDLLQRPPSVRLEQVQAYSPDVYITPQSAFQPGPIYAAQPTKVTVWSPVPRDDHPSPTGRPSSRLSYQQALEPQASSPRIHKTLFQWKEEARATTADYQRNGFPSPVAWVLIAPLSVSAMLT